MNKKGVFTNSCYNQNMDVLSVKQLAVPVLKRHGIVKASLFGSVVRGDTHKDSDVDMLVEIPHIYRGLDYFGFKSDLQEELEDKLHKKVDLVEYHLVKPSLKKYILPQQIQIL